MAARERARGEDGDEAGVQKERVCERKQMLLNSTTSIVEESSLKEIPATERGERSLTMANILLFIYMFLAFARKFCIIDEACSRRPSFY
mmetsp:Transcript_57394/g.171202  ORF Transcript_57394/g.171202 Transcript_57394/m.171202 type:complete len:89 (+) Transcript_57394:549-815(+)